MNSLAILNVEKFLIFTLVLTRTSGLLIASPVFGSTQAPATVRALISLALAALIMPSQWFATLPYPGSLLVYVLVIGSELVIGLVLGMGISILLGGIQMAGDMVSRVGGLTLSEIFDPTTSSNVPLFSQLLGLLSTALFMILGGHRMLLGGLLDTFSAIPPGGGLAMFFGTGNGASDPGFLASLVQMFLLLITQSFHVAIRAAAPVVTAVLLATLVLGDQPHAAAVERDGGRLRPECHDHLRRLFPYPGRQPAGFPGPDRAHRAGALPRLADPGTLGNPKYEYRNPKQIGNPKRQIQNGFRHSDFAF